ncbi:MAG: bifunctional diaminohydroxyphosphoribosylaminopyrimidine deaminase/5-amino-6-(5-phosphoribosylamino)uracil reductase RibD [Bacteroidales bacterium]|nr:bifunctional diaminohydroxyphosphoribosylaminopyrimidine deaminase/5-amino-6-(5-phosphoribosylamino)uracil reductase RibD [Bacteroidales bacterium]
MDNFKTDEAYMRRCIALAGNGRGRTAPNPMVGCVVVCDGNIIGEGYHRAYGGPHAEVNALDSVRDPSLLPHATLYVSLEPCAHYGKTPPCADRIVASRIPRVVIGSPDPNPKVSGRGVARLRAAGCQVTEGVLRTACDALNRSFLCYHLKHRPYIILKWAMSADGFIDAPRPEGTPVGPRWITGTEERALVHAWRAGCQAIMVGTRTALADDPSLTARDVPAASDTPMPVPTCYPHPLRIVLDRSLRLPSGLHLFDGAAPTWVLSERPATDGWRIGRPETELRKMSFDGNVWLSQLMEALYDRQIQSLMVEGGRQLLQTFIDADLWDEARVFSGKTSFGGGVPAPVMTGSPCASVAYAQSTLYFYRHG